MRNPPLYLQKVRVKNFKAIRDSGLLRLTPLTVFVGNNGVGKSSLVEALETVHIAAGDLVTGPEKAMRRWNGIEHITNKYAKPKPDSTAPIGIDLIGNLAPEKHIDNLESKFFRAQVSGAFIANRNLSSPRWVRTWKFTSKALRKQLPKADLDQVKQLLQDTFSFSAERVIASRWQFLLANPDLMGQLVPAQSIRNNTALLRDASNIAAYLRGMYEIDPSSFESLLDAMRMVVPYAKSIQHEQTGELIRNDYITLTESNFKIPGWLISTGTLRVLAILACLHHPLPPKLLVIEELENGLDPRTLGLVLAEIREAVEAGQTQVIITTHSPYLLDQVPLEYIVTVERQDGQPVFKRPADDESLEGWRNDFTNGQLFTMGTLWGRG